MRSLLSDYLQTVTEIDAHKSKNTVVIDGQNVSIASVVAVARHGVTATPEDSEELKEQVNKSFEILESLIAEGAAIYGITMGIGASAGDTRTTNVLAMRDAQLQLHSQCFVPDSAPTDVLPLVDPFSFNTMPESWVRGAMLIRMNTFIRGHSGVRWALIEKIAEVLRENLIPVVVLRASISASGDLTPLAQIAGTVSGNPYTRVFVGPPLPHARKILSAPEALGSVGIKPFSLLTKESLGIMNGTAYSASVAALALNEASQLTILSQVCTAMAVEALHGSRGSFHPFIQATARPHSGQIEVAENIDRLLEGSTFAVSPHGLSKDEQKKPFKPDRYTLRTAPQWIGPQVEDILHSIDAVTLECNSTTDNPLIDPDTGLVHNGGNFQAMAVSNAMEKTRLALHHIGKIIFTQYTEFSNPAMNNGLPPSLAATDPSLNMFAKGLDVSMAAYMSELGFLANPVTTNVQSAEVHNQAINSLALISARATITSAEIVGLMISAYLFVLCQALDLRVLQAEFLKAITEHILDSSQAFQDASSDELQTTLREIIKKILDSTVHLDGPDRLKKTAAECSTVLLRFSLKNDFAGNFYTRISEFEKNIAQTGIVLLEQLRGKYLSGERKTPASEYLGKTRRMYEFIRQELGIELHGKENFESFKSGIGTLEPSTGEQIAKIHKTLKDGRMDKVLMEMFSN